ncbi:MAG: hypothetical protein KGL46_11105 [Hyphomicrobiales bacterium]|nr:hypothetical protein [Hyphomicrobiales bacterium]
MFNAWARLSVESTMLAIEAQQVIALRLVYLSLGGPSAVRESQRMAVEKAVAALEHGVRVANGASTGDMVQIYRHKVRANRSRLAKSLARPRI